MFELPSIAIVSGCAVLGYLLTSILLARVFARAKVAKWKAFVPVVNLWKVFNLGGYHGYHQFWAIIGAALLSLVWWIAALITDQFSLTPEATTMVVAAIWAIGLFCSLVFIILLLAALLNFQAKFGKPCGFIVLAFISVFAPLWLWILAFDNSKFNDRLGRKKAIF
jgi:hypothetical protein